jgi:hypothetical protein
MIYPYLATPYPIPSCCIGFREELDVTFAENTQTEDLETDTWVTLGQAAQKALAQLSPRLRMVYALVLCEHDVVIMALVDHGDTECFRFPVEEAKEVVLQPQKGESRSSR